MAKENGRLQLKGDPSLIGTISAWLRPGMFAHIRPETGPISLEPAGARLRKPVAELSVKR